MPSLLSGLFPSRNRAKLARELENARQFGDQPFSWDWDERRALYAEWQALYDNTAYETQRDGGFREAILKRVYGGTTVEDDDPVCKLPLDSYFNPVRPIVDAYQNVLLGAFGREIKVAPEYNGAPVAPALREPVDNPLGRIWRWSNLDTSKQAMQRNAAGLGACGIRIVATGEQGAGRVSLQFDHPGRIKDFDTNDRGDVTAVLLAYTVMAGPLGEGRYEVEVEERIDKDSFAITYNGKKTEIPNPFGFCPYVILRHGDRGEFGTPAFFGSDENIHRINSLRSYIAKGVPDVVDTTWFATGSGPKPSRFTIGNNTVVYVRTDPDTPNPTFGPLVAPLDIAAAAAYAAELEDLVQQRQPEMLIGNVKLLSGISGETLAKVFKPAEARILDARAGYEHALIRGLQMGLSEMIILGLFDAGAGMGTAQAADAAYQRGLLNFEFEARPALPMTTYDRQQSALAEQAKPLARAQYGKALLDMGIDDETAFEAAGFSADEVKEIFERRLRQGSIPFSDLESVPVGGVPTPVAPVVGASVPGAPVADDGLNGAQITAAVDVLAKVGAGELSRFAATELLIAVGIPLDKARAIVNSQPKSTGISVDQK